jgi:hypothetical protein
VKKQLTNRMLLCLVIIVIMGLGGWIATQFYLRMKVLKTDDNAEIICLEFQKLLAAPSTNSLHETQLAEMLRQRIVARFGGNPQDGWGQQVTYQIKKVDSNYQIKVHSNGADGVADSDDDVVVTQTISIDGQVISTTIVSRH